MVMFKFPRSLFAVFTCSALLFASGCQLLPASKSQSQPTDEAASEPKLSEQERLVQGIEADLKALRLTTPEGNNALEKWETLKATYPDHPYVEKTPKKISQRYLWLTTRAIDKEDVIQAEQFLGLAKRFSPDPQQADDVEQSLTQLKQALAHRKAKQAAEEQAKREAEAAATQPEPVEPEPVPEPEPEVATAEPSPEPEPAAPAQPSVASTPLVTLDQDAIDARSMAIGLELDRVSPEIVEQGGAVVIRAQSMRDYRWLHALLKTSLYLIDSDYSLEAEPQIDSAQPAAVMIEQGS